MTRSDQSGDGRGRRQRTAASDGRGATLDRPVADRVTLARRLRAVERALGRVEGLEFAPGEGRETPDPDDLDAVAVRLDALCRAVRAIGECLDARERVRREEDAIESIRHAIESIPDVEGEPTTDGERPPDATDGTDGTDASHATGECGDEVGLLDRVTDGGPAGRAESATEWLDRVGEGGVVPPTVE